MSTWTINSITGSTQGTCSVGAVVVTILVINGAIPNGEKKRVGWGSSTVSITISSRRGSPSKVKDIPKRLQSRILTMAAVDRISHPNQFQF
jgi:hypothetical protein